MAIEKLGKKTSSAGRKFRNTILATALGATLIGGTSACDSKTGRGTDKESNKIETIVKPQDQVKTDSATFSEKGTNGEIHELDTNLHKRKIVATEEYDNESEHVIKKTYEDGAWSTETRDGQIFEYKEYYPNSDKMKFERIDLGKSDNAGRGTIQEGIYVIYDENGSIIFYESNILEENDGKYTDAKYDGEGRIISTKDGDEKYVYDDKNRQVTVTNEKYTNDKKKYTVITVYAMTENGEVDTDRIISKVFVGETGKEIDLMNGGIEKLIKDKGLEGVDYTDCYKDLGGE